MKLLDRIRTNRELVAQLERERAMHLEHLLDVIELTGATALHFGNAPERIWPEILENYREVARAAEAQVIIVSGDGRVRGVYAVSS